MNIPPKRQIVLQKDVVFYVYPLDKVEFDGKYLTVLPDGVNYDNLEKLMIEDTQLNELINKYIITSTIAKALDSKESEIKKTIRDQIFHGFIYDYPDLSSNEKCEGISIERKENEVTYKGQNFKLVTFLKKYNFSCLVKTIDDAIRQTAPDLSLEIEQFDKFIEIYINYAPLLEFEEFALRDVLSYIRNQVKDNKFNEFVSLLKELYAIHKTKTKAVDLFFDIAHRVKELAIKSREALPQVVNNADWNI